ncbi:unnamed protein product [Gongylonema pulchrum]|uniref:Transposase n=1 Tax=Gongylonema pulchrum TaxID=637853 RepID=A0A183DSC2_9BILA|nr:unnamed protein product [Gongylonema pulchrum]
MYPESDDVDESPDILVTDDGYTLTLPSGAKIGHRSLLRYYRQRLKPLGNMTKTEQRGQEALKKVFGQYKALGWTGTSGSLAVQRAKDIRYMKKLHSENWVKLGLSTNKLFVSRGRAGQ